MTEWLENKRFNCICGCSTLMLDEFDDSIGFSVIVSPSTPFINRLKAVIVILRGKIYSLYDVLVDKQEYKDFIKSEYERIFNA